MLFFYWTWNNCYFFIELEIITLMSDSWTILVPYVSEKCLRGVLLLGMPWYVVRRLMQMLKMLSVCFWVPIRRGSLFLTVSHSSVFYLFVVICRFDWCCSRGFLFDEGLCMGLDWRLSVMNTWLILLGEVVSF